MLLLILEATPFQSFICLLNLAKAFQRYNPLKIAINYAVEFFFVSSLVMIASNNRSR